jgi:hypothetical protein
VRAGEASLAIGERGEMLCEIARMVTDLQKARGPGDGDVTRLPDSSHLTEIHYRVNSKVDFRGKLLQLVAVWRAE